MPWGLLALTGLAVATLSLAIGPVRRRVIARLLGLPAPRFGVHARRGLETPTPDGPRLIADLYEPDRAGVYPTVLVRTPYGRAMEGSLVGHRLAERGFRVLVQDCRGCADSSGVFDPFLDDAADGVVTLEWLSGQPWFDAAAGVAMCGGSYRGFVQWAVSGATAPLRALAPSITAADLPLSFWRDGALTLQAMGEWMTLTAESGHEHRHVSFLRRQLRASERIRTLPWRHLPLRTLDERVVGREISFFREWIARPDPEDPYWTARRHGERVAAFDGPVQISTRWHDLFLAGALDDYQRLVAAGRSPRLRIGPGGHGDFRSAIGELRDDLAFLEHVLRDAPHPWPTRVRVYITGAKRWRDLPAWPPSSLRERWRLATDGQLLPGDTGPAPRGAVGQFRYDPLDPTPSVGGAQILSAPVADNRALEARDDVLVYTTPALERDLELIGPVTLRLGVATTAARAQLFVRVCEVDGRGRSRNVCDGVTTFRGDASAQPVTITLGPLGHRFRAGRRLRLQVSGGAFPRLARNPGRDVALDIATERELVAADYTLTATETTPCALELPVFDEP